MAKKKPAQPAQVDAPVAPDSVGGNAHPVKEQGSDLSSYEIKVSDALAPVGDFDPRKNLRTVCSGVWRYICEDVEKVDPNHFRGKLAKEYGIKENDMVYLVGNQKHKIVVV